MPKITDNSAYPQVTEVKENDILLGVQDGEVRQFPTSLLEGSGSGENWADITDQFVPFDNGTTSTGIMLPGSDYTSPFGTVRLTYQSINFFSEDNEATIRAIETITFTLLGIGGVITPRFFVPFLNVETDSGYDFEGTIRYGAFDENLEVAFFMEWDTPIDVFPDWDTDQEYPNPKPKILKIEKLEE